MKQIANRYLTLKKKNLFSQTLVRLLDHCDNDVVKSEQTKTHWCPLDNQILRRKRLEKFPPEKKPCKPEGIGGQEQVGPYYLKCPGSHEAEIDFDSRRKVPRGFKDNTNQLRRFEGRFNNGNSTLQCIIRKEKPEKRSTLNLLEITFSTTKFVDSSKVQQHFREPLERKQEDTVCV